MSASRSSWPASAWPTLLTMASSAARWRVSSMRRAFSSATLRLAARVARSRASALLKACGSRLSRAMTPRTRSPARMGTPSQRLGPQADGDGAAAGALFGGVEQERLARPDDDRRDAFAQRHRLGLVALALLHLVGEADLVRRRVVEGDEHRLRFEQPAHALAHELGDRREVELGGEGAADLVDQRQLGVALVGLGQQALGLLEEACVLQRNAHARREGGHEPLVGVAEGMGGRMGQDDDADHLLPGEERDAEPRLGRVRLFGEDRPHGDAPRRGCRVAASAWYG